MKIKLFTIALTTHNPKEKWREAIVPCVRKMSYDLLRMSSKDMSWMKELPIYQRVLNEEPKEVLKYKSSFQVYYARRPVSSKTDVTNDGLLANAGKSHSEADRNRSSKNATTIRKDARAATDRCSRRMVNTELKCNPLQHIALAKKFKYGL